MSTFNEYVNGISTVDGAGSTPEEVTGDAAIAVNNNLIVLANALTNITRYQGSWETGTSYHIGDIVVDGGTAYVAIATSTNDEPPSGNWTALGSAASTPTLESVTTAGATTDQLVTLSDGMNISGGGINFSNGSNSGGISFNSGGSILDSQPGTGYNGVSIGNIVIEGSTQYMLGGTINLNTGSGTGGGTLNMDEGNLQIDGSGVNTIAQYSGDGTGIAIGDALGNNNGSFLFIDSTDGVMMSFGLNLMMQGHNINLKDGSGTGGTILNLDGGIVTNAASYRFTGGAEIVAAIGGGININSGGTSVHFDFADNLISLAGMNLNLNDGSGTGGGTLNLDGGTINGGSGATLQDDGSGNWEIQGQLKHAVIETRSTIPGSPVAGQLLFYTPSGTLQLFDGSAWNTITMTPS